MINWSFSPLSQEAPSVGGCWCRGSSIQAMSRSSLGHGLLRENIEKVHQQLRWNRASVLRKTKSIWRKVCLRLWLTQPMWKSGPSTANRWWTQCWMPKSQKTARRSCTKTFWCALMPIEADTSSQTSNISKICSWNGTPTSRASPCLFSKPVKSRTSQSMSDWLDVKSKTRRNLKMKFKKFESCIFRLNLYKCLCI